MMRLSTGVGGVVVVVEPVSTVVAVPVSVVDTVLVVVLVELVVLVVVAVDVVWEPTSLLQAERARTTNSKDIYAPSLVLPESTTRDYVVVSTICQWWSRTTET